MPSYNQIIINKMKKILLLPAAIAFVCLAGPSAMAQNIYTFAGIAGTNGYTGDDSLATTAEISGPGGVACNASGIIYFADTRNNVVRMISTSGIITTVAGNGTGGYSGDGGPATAAKLRNPGSVTTDASGNIFIADTRNNVVRKVDGSGNITTVAGTGTAGYTGDGGPASAAQLRNPVGLAISASGNLFIADSRNNVIREVTSSGNISTIAGNGTAGYAGDTGPATSAQLSNPLGISLTASGSLYIADSRNNAIRVINTSGIINTFAGTGVSGHTGDGGPATAATLHYPSDVTTDAAGLVFIADSSHTVRSVSTLGTITNFAGTGIPGYNGDGGAATAAKMTAPDGLAIDAAHNVYIATGNNVIRRVGAAIAGINITSNTGDTLCIGHVTDFTATPVADATPHYQWQQNGVNVGTDNIHYTPASLATGDVIQCFLLTVPGGGKLAISNNLRIDSLPRAGINGPTLFCVGSNANLVLAGPPPPGGAWLSSNTAVATIAPPSRVTGVSIGTATIYFIATNVCGTDTASHAITVSANNIGAVTGPTDVCVGSTVTFTDTTASGKWRARPGFVGTIDSVTGTFTAGFVPGPATIIYSTSPGCYRIDTIIIDSLPPIAPITGSNMMMWGETITLSDATAGGTWSSSNTTIASVSATGDVTGLAAGTAVITYTVTSLAGCPSDTTYLVTVSGAWGVKPIAGQHSISIFPNPNYGTLMISRNGQATGTAAVTISDVAGRTVYTAEVPTGNGTTSLNISSLKPGFYTVMLQFNGELYYDKLLIAE
jgi:hypothetical protein